MTKTNNYSDKLKDPRWQKKRLQIMNRDGFSCRNCGDSESTLQVHHLEYMNNPWDVDDKKLLTLCESCHNEFSELNSKIKFCLSEITSTDTLFEVSEFLMYANKANPFDISQAIRYLRFIQSVDYKIALSFDSFMERFKELSDERR